MPSILQSTKNTRAILPNGMRYIRSDIPQHLTAVEIQWLLENNVRTIVDLREEKERQQKKCPLEENPAFTYFHMPVTGGNVIPKSPADVPLSYLNMVDEKMKDIIHIIESAETNVLYFCNAGKDRTGVVSALLLLRQGMSADYIIADYLKSGENLQEMLQSFSAVNPEVDIRVITPAKEYMVYFLKHCPLWGTLL